MNSKLHAVTDAIGRPLRMFLTAGQRSDYIGARALLSSLPEAKHMLADRGYDADWYREALEAKYVSRRSIREIAAQRSSSEKAVESLLSRARQAFRETFAAMTRNLNTETS